MNMCDNESEWARHISFAVFNIGVKEDMVVSREQAIAISKHISHEWHIRKIEGTKKMEKHMKPVANAMLQALVDGKLDTPASVSNLVARFKPKAGFTPDDWVWIASFGTELRAIKDIKTAKIVGEKYSLNIMY